MSVSKFDELVRDGRLPGGHRLDGCIVWELRELNDGIDALLYGDEASAVIARSYDEEWAD